MITRNTALSFLFVGVIATTVVVGVSGCGKDEAKQPAAETEASVEAEPGLAFPYEMDGGKLVVNSIFQSDIDNPDNENEYADGIASMEMKNASGQFLKEATVHVTMLDGTALTFVAEDIPDGATVWAFETTNQTIDLQAPVEAISCEATFDGADMLMSDMIEVSVEDINVTLTNTTGEDLEDLTVYCHCDFGDSLYGGLAYAYPVEDLPADGSVTVAAEDCFLGTAAVVMIEK